MERRIRDTKRRLMGYEAAGDTERYQRTAALLRKQNAAYDAYCKENGLTKQTDRISIAKWNRSEAAKAREAARRKAKMAADIDASNDWSSAHPRFVTKAEKAELIEYAKNAGIIIPGLRNFDGDPELLKATIDALGGIQKDYPVKKPVILSIGNIHDDGEFGNTVEFHITLNVKALRNRSVTEQNITKDDMFASKTLEDIVIHEYGHIINYAIGYIGVDLALEAYYNTYGSELKVTICLHF